MELVKAAEQPSPSTEVDKVTLEYVHLQRPDDLDQLYQGQSPC